jgi:hypothetical protein
LSVSENIERLMEVIGGEITNFREREVLDIFWDIEKWEGVCIHMSGACGKEYRFLT